ncbi:(2Fe-2S) ferredoxin domain-containing protein [Streptomyces sp. XM4193]|uniref:(2Fe-2S) ferredoxin domain-containing protein n=1 Tax=Streptomyces sp. XM4193 TaxID=2929782 RepID=UPI001FFADC3A|nr:(2Fe-2S) ferredoxin domain-containing protein [Streptomyces sp. XM4193]MCK1798739.1 (2Fe-2S) ferredoxin domain-containing protein [Streptomyces sp. XM4193]
MPRHRPETVGAELASARPAPCRVVVCRDCCCGTAKVTGVDHDWQVARLAEEVPVRVADCLEVCEEANVIVVQPSAAARVNGARPVWLGLVNEPAATEDVADWVRAGGPGVAPRPDVLDRYVLTPSRRAR